MKLRSQLPASLLLAVLVPLIGGTPDASAQRTVATNAADVAAQSRGTVESRVGGRLVSGALYVSIRSGSADDVVALARRYGLEPAVTSPLGFFSPQSEKSRRATLQSLPADRRARSERLAAELSRVIELYYTADLHPEDAARRLRQSPLVEYAEAVPAGGIEGASLVPNDSLIGEQPHLVKIKAFEAWDVWPGDSNTVIGIVDAGIDNQHEDLAPNIRENAGEEGLDASSNDKRTNGVDDDGNGVIDDWRGANLNAPGDGSTHGDTRASQHGTAVAGAAAARTNNRIGIAGVGYHCQFFPVKTMPRSGGALTKSYAGIEYCAREGMAVVNCSFGDRDFSRTQQTFISYLVETYDIAIVAAGGNEAAYSPRYPAGYRGVLGVGALDPTDGFATAYGEQVDVSAPVGMTTIDNDTYAQALVATSFSSPVAAGVVALTRSRWPALSAMQAIAHVRLTSDTLAATGDRYRLIGFGRVNALNAVSVDPMSRPGVIVDTVWLTDEAGAVRETFAVGERGRIVVRVRNLLGPAENLRVRLVDYRDADASVVIDSTWHDVGAVATGGVATVTLPYPFRLDRPDTNRLKLRVEFMADDGYADFDFAAPFVYLERPSIAIYATSELALSVSSRGNIGYADYPENGYGIGVTYNNESFLFEGGFLAATSSQRVVNNIRGDNVSYQDRDFTALETPSDSNGHTLTLADLGAPEENQIGLEMRIRTIVNNDIPNAFAMHVRARNVGATPIDSLRLATFGDWDLKGEGDGQTIVTREDVTARVPVYAVISGEGYVVASGAIAPDRAPILYAIENGGTLNIFDGFPRDKKWFTLSNGIGARSAGPADISLVVGRVLTDLDRDEEDTVLFVVGIARLESEAVAAMQELAGAPTSGVDDEFSAVTGMLGAARPNPASIVARVAVDVRSGATFGLYDALGRIVLDLTERIPSGGSGDVVIDTRTVAPGVYLLRAADGRGAATAPLVIVR
jgi:serine protease